MNAPNPFNPSFGKVPPVFIDREQAVQTLTEGLADRNSPWQTTMICGVRGVGKTAVLAEICRRLEEDPGWIVADIPSNGDVMQTLVQSVHEKANSDLRKAIDAIEGVSISILGIGIEYSREKGSVNYQILLEKILVELRKRKLSLLIAIDEAGASREMKQFASVYQIMLRKNYPLSLVMTGLPRNISELQNDHTLTFLLRSARIDLPMLDPVSVQFSYQKVFADGGKTILQDCLRRMTELTNGYSYAFQLLGYLVWNTGAGEITGEVVDSVLYPYKEQLFRNAYSRIYEDLSGVDREFVLAMARAGEKTIAMKSITERMKKVPNYVSTYKRRLMEAGVVRADSYGYVSFALPLFDEYVREFRM